MIQPALRKCLTFAGSNELNRPDQELSSERHGFTRVRITRTTSEVRTNRTDGPPRARAHSNQLPKEFLNQSGHQHSGGPGQFGPFRTNTEFDHQKSKLAAGRGGEAGIFRARTSHGKLTFPPRISNGPAPERLPVQCPAMSNLRVSTALVQRHAGEHQLQIPPGIRCPSPPGNGPEGIAHARSRVSRTRAPHSVHKSAAGSERCRSQFGLPSVTVLHRRNPPLPGPVASTSPLERSPNSFAFTSHRFDSLRRIDRSPE